MFIKFKLKKRKKIVIEIEITEIVEIIILQMIHFSY